MQNLPGKSVAAFDKLCARVNEGEQTDYQAYTNLLKEGRTLPFILPSLSTRYGPYQACPLKLTLSIQACSRASCRA